MCSSDLTGVMKGCLKEGDAGVFVGDFFRRLRSRRAIVKSDYAGIVIRFFRIRKLSE